MFTSGGHCYLQVVQHGATTRSFAITCGRRQVSHVSPLHVFYCQLVGSDFCADGLQQEHRKRAWKTSLCTSLQYAFIEISLRLYATCFQLCLHWMWWCLLPHLCLLRTLKRVDSVSKVGRERVVKLAQRLLQRLKRLFVLLQRLQLLLETDLPVHRLEDTPSSTCVCHETQPRFSTFWQFDNQTNAKEQKVCLEMGKKEKVECCSYYLTNKYLFFQLLLRVKTQRQSNWLTSLGCNE